MSADIVPQMYSSQKEERSRQGRGDLHREEHVRLARFANEAKGWFPTIT